MDDSVPNATAVPQEALNSARREESEIDCAAPVLLQNGDDSALHERPKDLSTIDTKTQMIQLHTRGGIKPPHMFKKVAAKTLLSQLGRPTITNVTTMMTPSLKKRKATDSNNSEIQIANRPPTEVTIQTKKKIPAKKVMKQRKHDVAGDSNTETAKKRSKERITISNSFQVKAAASTINSQMKNDLEWEGVPTDIVPFDINWDGWVKRSYKRRTGDRLDNYWYTPQNQYKLRSIKEVHRFVQCCAKCKNDEVEAYNNLKK